MRHGKSNAGHGVKIALGSQPADAGDRSRDPDRQIAATTLAAPPAGSDTQLGSTTSSTATVATTSGRCTTGFEGLRNSNRSSRRMQTRRRNTAIRNLPHRYWTKAIRTIRRQGREAWKEHIGYHRRSLRRNGHESHEVPFGDEPKNRLLLEPTGRGPPEMQDPQPLHPSRAPLSSSGISQQGPVEVRELHGSGGGIFQYGHRSTSAASVHWDNVSTTDTAGLAGAIFNTDSGRCPHRQQHVLNLAGTAPGPPRTPVFSISSSLSGE